MDTMVDYVEDESYVAEVEFAPSPDHVGFRAEVEVLRQAIRQAGVEASEAGNMLKAAHGRRKAMGAGVRADQIPKIRQIKQHKNK